MSSYIELLNTFNDTHPFVTLIKVKDYFSINEHLDSNEKYIKCQFAKIDLIVRRMKQISSPETMKNLKRIILKTIRDFITNVYVLHCEIDIIQTAEFISIIKSLLDDETITTDDLAEIIKYAIKKDFNEQTKRKHDMKEFEINARLEKFLHELNFVINKHGKVLNIAILEMETVDLCNSMLNECWEEGYNCVFNDEILTKLRLLKKDMIKQRTSPELELELTNQLQDLIEDCCLFSSCLNQLEKPQSDE